VSDTPRTDAAYFKPHATMYDLAGEMKLIERELSVANKRIKELEAKVDELHDLEKWLEGR
jgi:cell division protein FtsL